MSERVFVAMPPPAGAPWRTVRFALPIQQEDLDDVWSKDVARQVVSRVLGKLGLPHRRGQVSTHTLGRGHVGYIRVYRGTEPTARDKALLKRALAATRAEVAKIPAARFVEDPPSVAGQLL